MLVGILLGLVVIGAVVIALQAGLFERDASSVALQMNDPGLIRRGGRLPLVAYIDYHHDRPGGQHRTAFYEDGTVTVEDRSGQSECRGTPEQARRLWRLVRESQLFSDPDMAQAGQALTPDAPMQMICFVRNDRVYAVARMPDALYSQGIGREKFLTAFNAIADEIGRVREAIQTGPSSSGQSQLP